MTSIRWLVVLSLIGLPAVARGGVSLDPASAENPVWSPAGGRIALSGPDGNGLYVYDLASGDLLTVSEQPSAGYAANWSPDGGRLGFKLFVADARRAMPWQVPAVLDLASGAVIRLSEPIDRAGVPSFAADGRIAVSLGERIAVFDAAGQRLRDYPVGVYANLVAMSPDGALVAFNDDRDAIWLLETRSGALDRITGGGAWYRPLWSPDGNRLLVHGISGALACIDLSRGATTALPAALQAAWLADAETIVYASYAVPDARALPEADLHQVRCDGAAETALAITPGRFERFPAPSPDGRQLIYRVEGDGLVVAPLGGSLRAAARPLFSGLRSRSAVDGELPPPPAPPSPLAVTQIEGVTYLHQVYDTPNDFDGHWACNATSAMMTIAWRGILPHWDTTVGVPWSHVSHWGNYISEIYDFGGHQFSESSADPDGVAAHGGYGYITRNDWADTKGYMRDYLRLHGLESEVDWAPSWDKLVAEVAARQPFVVLSSITSSGHYTVAIGNYTDQHSVVFNDPYGDKNLGYMNYEGAGAVYDWPGYNNGNASLNTVHCFIWSRADEPQPGSLAGTVRDAAESAPLAGASVALVDGPTTTSGPDGTYRFDGLAAGSYTVVVSAECRAEQSQSASVSAGATATVDFDLADDGTCPPIDLPDEPADEPADTASGDAPEDRATALAGGCQLGPRGRGGWWLPLLAGLLLAQARRRRGRSR